MCGKELLPIVWLCKILTKRFSKRHFVKVSDEAVFNGDCGVLCDCGRWTFGDDNYHKPIKREYREIFYKDSLE